MTLSPNTCSCSIAAEPIGPSMVGSCSTQFLLFMTILESFITSRCDLADMCKRFKSRDVPNDNYDFVVIGGGTAGSVVASRLSENPQWKVLLIEAGGDEPTPASVPAWVSAYWNNVETDWMYKTEPQENACLSRGGVCDWPRGKMLGGTSVINGMMYMRGHASDYDRWAAEGAKGWSWGEVFPYFLKSEDNKEIGKGVSNEYHNRGGPWPVQKFRNAPQLAHDVVAASIEQGYPPTNDLNGAANIGFTIAQATNDGGSRYSTARAFLRPAHHRRNLHVLLKAQVSKVIVDPVEKKVTAVQYLKDGQFQTVRVNKEAIISAGAIGSPQILLLSGIGAKQTLDKFNIPTIQDLPGVGQNLHNHVGVFMSFELNNEPEVTMLNWQTATQYLLDRNGPLSGTGMWQVTGIINSKYANPDGQDPDVQMFFGGYGGSCGDGEVLSQTKRDLITARRQAYISAVNLHPESRGYVTLQSPNPLDPPVMQPNYFLDPRDLDVTVDAAKVALKLANSTILREKYGMVSTQLNDTNCKSEDEDEFLKCLTRYYTAPENHQVGTCKMGAADDVMAVVDPELKVYGIKGLRVADASIMPRIVSGNIAAPIVMIGERAAEFITTNYQRSKNDNSQGQGDKWDYSGLSNEAQDNQDNGQHNLNRWKHWNKDWQTDNWRNPHYNWNKNTQ